jgi:hypothetical protein
MAQRSVEAPTATHEEERSRTDRHLLDEVDKEPEKRGHAFLRYADDGNVYVRSERTANHAEPRNRSFVAAKMGLRALPGLRSVAV